MISRLKGVDVGDAITKINRKEPIQNLDDKQREAIGMLYALWFGKEPSHPNNTYGHRRDLTYSLMVSELMRSKEGHKKYNISERIGFHPASFSGAQEEARQVTAEMLCPEEKFQLSPKKERNRTNRIKRERALIEAWFQRHAQDLPILDRKPTIDDVEKIFREKLRQYLGQS